MRLLPNPVLVSVLCALALGSCSDSSEVEVTGDSSKIEAGVPEATARSDESLFLLDSRWIDQGGTTRVLEDFGGKLTVVAMIFTNCAYACPRIIVDLKGIETAVPSANRDDVQFLLISMDSDRDTPEVLTQFAAKEGLDLSRWTLLHGDEFAVRGVGAALGVRFKKGPKGDFAHSNIITVLDKKGTVIHKLEGLGADASSTNKAIRAALP